jgi:hypothetical protein
MEEVIEDIALPLGARRPTKEVSQPRGVDAYMSLGLYFTSQEVAITKTPVAAAALKTTFQDVIRPALFVARTVSQPLSVAPGARLPRWRSAAPAVVDDVALPALVLPCDRLIPRLERAYALVPRLVTVA